nr:LPS assembly lipoprotein LptE [Conchiformibius kuhniae]
MIAFRTLGLCLLLGACGFQPKGSFTALPMHAWQLEHTGETGEMDEALRDALRRIGALGHPSAERRLRVTEIERRKEIYTITRAAKVSEYRLDLTMTVQALRGGKPHGDAIRVAVTRTLPYADALVLGKQEEEAQIWREMYQDAADQIVRRLAFLSVSTHRATHIKHSPMPCPDSDGAAPCPNKN